MSDVLNVPTNSNWGSFLRAEGAIFNAAGEVTGFSAASGPLATLDAHLTDLSPLALIHVSGADARTFLNAQLTNNIAQLDSTHTQLAAWCSPKGRMLAVMRVIPIADDYLLQLPAVLVEDILKRLRIFVLRSKVKLENASNEWVRLGVAGPTAANIVRDVTGLQLLGENTCAIANGVIALRIAGIHPRFELLLPPAQAPTLWAALKQQARPSNWAHWLWHDITAGIPTVLPETVEVFVPQMANMDLIDGVSFTKGCYPGQEIVARVHYRGRIKERMFHVRVSGDEAPQPGQAIYASDTPNQSVGTVMMAAASDGGYDALAVLQLHSVQFGELRLGSVDGKPLVLQSLPYVVPMEE